MSILNVSRAEALPVDAGVVLADRLEGVHGHEPTVRALVALGVPLVLEKRVVLDHLGTHTLHALPEPAVLGGAYGQVVTLVEVLVKEGYQHDGGDRLEGPDHRIARHKVHEEHGAGACQLEHVYVQREPVRVEHGICVHLDGPVVMSVPLIVVQGSPAPEEDLGIRPGAPVALLAREGADCSRRLARAHATDLYLDVGDGEVLVAAGVVDAQPPLLGILDEVPLVATVHLRHQEAEHRARGPVRPEGG
mmetsp:Transcript_131850/g.358060  ORF Transcript_131850/g.358060 Transcript_131850/m.358060 type:complete len:248 (-) Transcript_131850:671-1414(-)